jgi:uncharacterized membrane protein
MTTVAVAIIPTLFVIASYMLARRKIEQIHVLVNSRLSDALKEITSLKKLLGIPENDRDNE